MNYFAASYNPMNAFAQGYGLGDAMRETAARAHERQQAMAARQGLIDFGQGTNLAGFENDPEAVRPDWLKKLYTVNPDVAVQLERQAASPFELERQAKKAGDIERAKVMARTEAFAPYWNDAETGQQTMPATGETMPAGLPVTNAFATGGAPLSVGVGTEQGTTVPGAGMVRPMGVGSYTNTMSGDSLRTASGQKKIKRMSAEHGPSIEWQQMSPFEMEQARIDAAQKGRDLELKGQKSADDLRVSAETSRRQADEQVYSIQKELTAVKQAMTGPGIKPRDAIDRINELNDELKSAKARRDSIYFGRDAAAPQTAELTDEEKAMAKAGPGTKRPTAPAPTQSVTSTSARASAPPSAMSADPTIGAGLPYQQQVAMQQEKIKGDLASQQKAKQEKTTAMNKLIEDAQGDHMRLRSMKDQVDRMIQLSKEGIGSRVMGQLPFGMGEAFQRAWSGRNDELQSLRGPAIQLFMSANSSKMMDTPKEVERLTGGVPDVGRDEDVNKRNAAIMGNDFYSSLQKTPAMEWWSHNKGTMDGFSQAWDDWRQHNPQYTVSVKNGQTYLDDAPYVMPPTKWMQLRKKYSSEQIKTLQERGLDYKD